eukprot:2838338-Rhodomonas_salina.1
MSYWACMGIGIGLIWGIGLMLGLYGLICHLALVAAEREAVGDSADSQCHQHHWRGEREAERRAE